MGTFELEGQEQETDNCKASETAAKECRPLKEECIIALKVYDQCRIQECLTPRIIGPARIAPSGSCECDYPASTTPIIPPREAASVSIEDLYLRCITIVNVEPNAFKRGYWDVCVRFVFDYTLNFKDAAGCELEPIEGNNVYDKTITLFGSAGSDILIGSDIFPSSGESSGAPNAVVEGKVVPLGATLVYPRKRPDLPEDVAATEVGVTIGLFAIIKLVRIVNLTVQSHGFCIPPKCHTPSPMNPCEFFDELDFPLDIFAPPQKEDFDCVGTPGPHGVNC